MCQVEALDVWDNVLNLLRWEGALKVIPGCEDELKRNPISRAWAQLIMGDVAGLTLQTRGLVWQSGARMKTGPP